MPFTSWNEFKKTRKVVYTEDKIRVEDKPKPGPTSDISKINEATVEDLTTIKGIGPKTAQKILDAMPVEKIDDLSKIPIKPAILKRLREWAGF